MGKQLKDFLPFYIGCPIWDFYNEKEGILFGINGSSVNNVIVLHGGDVWKLRYTSIKPILRLLSSVTDDEKRQCDIDSNVISNSTNHIESWAARINWFRKRFIDVDGLIKSGLAIDATTINPPPTIEIN